MEQLVLIGMTAVAFPSIVHPPAGVMVTVTPAVAEPFCNTMKKLAFPRVVGVGREVATFTVVR